MNEPKQPSLIQKRFDIPKFVEQRRLLDATTFEKHERKEVGDLLLKSLLNRFGSMQECVESQVTLGRVFGRSREWINVAINRLVAIDVITKDFKRNERYGKELNHYRVNWGELGRRLERKANNQKQPDQCEDSPDTNVRIHGGPMLGSTPDQCEVSPDTNVRFHGDRNRRTNEIETTTTNDEWKPVVVLLEKVGVKRCKDAIDTAKERGDSPGDVLRIIERTIADPRHEGKELGGIVKNQVCTPSKVEPVRPSRPKPDREQIWKRVFKEMVPSGKACTELDQAAIDAKTDAILKRKLAEYAKQRDEQKNPFGTLATEPTP